MQPKRTPLERVLARTVCDLTTRCWLCALRPKPGGHVQLICDGRSAYAHRITYEAFVGPVPAGLDLDHLCRRPNCCSPAHLEPVTHRVNMLRGQGFSGVNAAKTHCIHGHEFTPENTIASGVHRRCRICRRATKRAFYRRHHPDVPGPVRGERTANAKLTDALVRHFRSLPRRRGLVADLAREHGLDYKTVWDALNGRRWRHVT